MSLTVLCDVRSRLYVYPVHGLYQHPGATDSGGGLYHPRGLPTPSRIIKGLPHNDKPWGGPQISICSMGCFRLVFLARGVGRIGHEVVAILSWHPVPYLVKVATDFLGGSGLWCGVDWP